MSIPQLELSENPIASRKRLAARKVDNPDNSRWVTEQLQAVNEQLAEIESDLGAVRSPTARAALGADIKRLKIQHAELTRKLQAEPVSHADITSDMRDGILKLAEHPEAITLHTAPKLLRGMVFRVRDKRVGW